MQFISSIVLIRCLWRAHHNPLVNSHMWPVATVSDSVFLAMYYTKKLLLVYLKHTFNWASCTLSGNPK